MLSLVSANRVLYRSFLAFTLMLVSVSGISSANAAQAQAPSSVQSEERYLNINSKLFRYHIDYFQNKHGEREMQVSLVEAHWLARDSRLVVLKGRDTDADNLIDAWFYNEGQIVKTIKQSAKTSDAWPVAKEILKQFSLNEARWISTLITKEILAGLFFTIEGEIEDTKELEQMQIDLHDLDYKIAALEKSKEDPVLAQELKRVSNAGWKRLMDRFTNVRAKDRRDRVMGDVALFIGGGLALKGATFLAVKGLSSDALASVKTYLNKMIENQNTWISRVSAKASADAAGADSFSALRFGSESEALAFLSNKTYFSSGLRNVGSFLKNVAKETWGAKWYIAGSQSIQLAVESYNAGYWKFSEPLVLTQPVESTDDFLHKVTSDENLIHNVKYMTMQTTLLSGVEETLDHKGYGLKVKIPVCSVITFVDSMSMNVLFNKHGDGDMKRVGFDTGWELLIGTNQVLLDKFMIRKMGTLAAKLKKPKLRFLGYVLAGVDQLAGYIAYNKATKTWFPKEVEHGEAVKNAENEAQKNPPPPVVVIPVFAPKNI